MLVSDLLEFKLVRGDILEIVKNKKKYGMNVCMFITNTNDPTIITVCDVNDNNIVFHIRTYEVKYDPGYSDEEE